MVSEPMEFTWGISIDIKLPEVDVHGREQFKKFRRTGCYPSPAYDDLLAVANAAVDFLNGHFGTKFAVVEHVDFGELKHTCAECGEELQAVRPGKYQCAGCEIVGV